jgi:peptidoglycan-N-acetylglucosamine deacetylase
MPVASRGVLMLALAAIPVVTSVGWSPQAPASAQSSFTWPQGARAALSLTFDDARESQLDVGVPLLAEHGIHVTFYLTANDMRGRADAWKRAAAAGHELGNHTLVHPCSGNFAWARAHALEDYTLEGMRTELVEANRQIAAATGITPVTFAYPCGQTFVGRADRVVSIVPLVHELFLAGRGWLDEGPNDPVFVDRAQLFGYPMDDVTFAKLKPALDDAIARGQWLVLAGHDIGQAPGHQVTRVSMLRELLPYARAPSRGVWVDTVARVAEHVKRTQGTGAISK